MSRKKMQILVTHYYELFIPDSQPAAKKLETILSHLQGLPEDAFYYDLGGGVIKFRWNTVELL